ncbi:lysine-specific demethylase 7B-like [Brevipalpus obovatus]|uniref:lysine-specific demethylase 7B-like n=1 Tax=Brevipalpus obovatus TaxID=246614 RepID=UPI003D9F2AA5
MIVNMPENNDMRSRRLSVDGDTQSGKMITKRDTFHQQKSNVCAECGEQFDSLVIDELWIECDHCSLWFHFKCVDLLEIDLDHIDEFHCNECQELTKLIGPSTVKKVTNNYRHDQYEKNPIRRIQAGSEKFVKRLRKRRFGIPNEDVLHDLPADELNVVYLIKNGFDCPILVRDKQGLGMRVPPSNFSVENVMELITAEYELDVIDSRRQLSYRMQMVEFLRRINLSPDQRKEKRQILNCISLEVSRTKLSELISPPTVVEKLSIVENSWPDAEMKPYVAKYCLISMRDSYTDFHIDFGGTSVWYHIVKGEKIFYLIQPTVMNLEKYKEWSTSLDQSEKFFPKYLDAHSQCYQLTLKEGNTLFIPSGWIHAVLTTQDSLVFGGNFLHPLSIKSQLETHDMELELHTAPKFMFPFFELTMWYGVRQISKFCKTYFKRRQPPERLLEEYEELLSYLKRKKLEAEEQSSSNGDFSPLAPKDPMAKTILNELKTIVRRLRKLIYPSSPDLREIEAPRILIKEDGDVLVEERIRTKRKYNKSFKNEYNGTIKIKKEELDD